MQFADHPRYDGLGVLTDPREFLLVHVNTEAGAFRDRGAALGDLEAPAGDVLVILIIEVGGVRDVGQCRAKVHGHRLGQGAAGELNDARGVGFGGSPASTDRIGDAAFGDHVEVGAPLHDLRTTTKLGHVHEQGQAGLLAQPVPAFEIAPVERVFENADDRIFLDFGDETHDRTGGAVVVEIPVEFEPRGRHVLHGLGLFDDTVVGAGVHLEEHVAFGGGTLHFGGQILRRRRAGPGCDGNTIADLLTDELVGGDLQVLADGVKDGTGQAGVLTGQQKVDGIAADHAIDLGLVHADMTARVTPADDAVVAGDLEDGLGINPGKARLLIGIASAQFRIDLDGFDVGDLHRLCS